MCGHYQAAGGPAPWLLSRATRGAAAVARTGPG